MCEADRIVKGELVCPMSENELKPDTGTIESESVRIQQYWHNRCEKQSEEIHRLTQELEAARRENESLKIGREHTSMFFQVATDNLGFDPSCEPGKLDPMCVADAIRGLANKNKELETLCREMKIALEHCRNRPHEHNPPKEFTMTHCEVIDDVLAKYHQHSQEGRT